MTSLNLPSLASELHDSRKSDAKMADWARRYGQRLIDELREYVDAFTVPPAEPSPAQQCRRRGWLPSYHGEGWDCTCGDCGFYASGLTYESALSKMIDAHASPAEPEIVLPEPTPDGRYHFADGSVIIPALGEENKWIARISSDVIRCSKSDWRVRFFDTPLEAARALAALGEGPAAGGGK